MNLFAIMFIGSLTGFVVIVILCVRNIAHSRKQTRKELSASSECYGGPAGEPLWDGELPARVEDYTEPRYVYENLKESSDYLPENGRIIGYRISPELVIHSRVKQCLNLPHLSDYISRYGGKLLNLNECSLLLSNWDKVSQLREKAGDEPLKVKSFWALSEHHLPVRLIVKSELVENVYRHDDWNDLILKR
ncbi:MAG: hypothetical protein Q4D80_06025 [Pseudomonadota bacterium]|nr:hypothetical protein [Pseudomonadota bacterium]